MAPNEQERSTSGIYFLILCAFLLLARLGYWFIASPERFPLSQVKITGTFQHVTREQLSSIVSPYLNYSYFTIPLSQLKRELNQVGWIEKANVDRIWPNQLTIDLFEKKPIALWNGNLVTQDGQWLRSADMKIPENLPKLVGPDYQQQEVLQKFQKLSNILMGIKLSLSTLKLYPNQSWSAELSNGVIIKLGKQGVEAKLERFCKAYRTALADRSDQLAAVDLRYARGMAVKWKERAEK